MSIVTEILFKVQKHIDNLCAYFPSIKAYNVYTTGIDFVFQCIGRISN